MSQPTGPTIPTIPTVIVARATPPAGYSYNDNGILVPVVSGQPRQRCKNCKCGANMGKTCSMKK